LKLLIDENLPIALGRGLGLKTVHTTELGNRLSDLELWDEAIAQESVLVTRDTDFFDRMSLIGPPPKVIWIRLGNMRRKELERVFSERWPKIDQLLQTSDLVEIFIDSIEGISFT
jgi:predicted nuclease of predicted toxin-antitoxin system